MEFNYRGYRGPYMCEEGVYFGQVLNTGAELISFQGDTVAGAYSAFKDAVNNYLN